MDLSIRDVVSDLFECGDLKRAIGPFRFNENGLINEQLKKDFECELVLILLEYKDWTRVVEMYSRNRSELMRFLIKIVKNNIMSVTSPYWKKYGMWEYNRETLIDDEND